MICVRKDDVQAGLAGPLVGDGREQHGRAGGRGHVSAVELQAEGEGVLPGGLWVPSMPTESCTLLPGARVNGSLARLSPGLLSEASVWVITSSVPTGELSGKVRMEAVAAGDGAAAAAGRGLWWLSMGALQACHSLSAPAYAVNETSLALTACKTCDVRG